ELLRYPEAWSAWGEADRILPLLRNTLVLALGAVTLTAPLGAVLAFLFYRADLPGRVAIRRLVVLALFVPLPLLAAAGPATLPRAMPAIGAAALWVALQAATEISVTDLMQVRTFAEEVYTQFSRPDPEPGGDVDLGMARALAVAVPPALLTALLITALVAGSG